MEGVEAQGSKESRQHDWLPLCFVVNMREDLTKITSTNWGGACSLETEPVGAADSKALAEHGGEQ